RSRRSRRATRLSGAYTPRQLRVVAERNFSGLHREPPVAARRTGSRVLRGDGTARLSARGGSSTRRGARSHHALFERRGTIRVTASGVERRERCALFSRGEHAGAVDAAGAG